MRISDWSSDVCSSDLSSLDRFALTWQRIGYRQGAIRPTERRSAVPDRPAPGRAVGWGTRGNIPCPNGAIALRGVAPFLRSEEHTSELQSLMRISYAVFCLKKKTNTHNKHTHTTRTK